MLYRLQEGKVESDSISICPDCSAGINVCSAAVQVEMFWVEFAGASCYNYTEKKRQAIIIEYNKIVSAEEK